MSNIILKYNDFNINESSLVELKSDYRVRYKVNFTKSEKTLYYKKKDFGNISLIDISINDDIKYDDIEVNIEFNSDKDILNSIFLLKVSNTSGEKLRLSKAISRVSKSDTIIVDLSVVLKKNIRNVDDLTHGSILYNSKDFKVNNCLVKIGKLGNMEEWYIDNDNDLSKLVPTFKMTSSLVDA